MQPDVPTACLPQPPRDGTAARAASHRCQAPGGRRPTPRLRRAASVPPVPHLPHFQEASLR